MAYLSIGPSLRALFGKFQADYVAQSAELDEAHDGATVPVGSPEHAYNMAQHSIAGFNIAPRQISQVNGMVSCMTAPESLPRQVAYPARIVPHYSSGITADGSPGNNGNMVPVPVVRPGRLPYPSNPNPGQ